MLYHDFDIVTLTLKVDLLYKKLTRTMTFESEGLLIVAIYIWLPPASYVVFLTTLVLYAKVTYFVFKDSSFPVKAGNFNPLNPDLLTLYRRPNPIKV